MSSGYVACRGCGASFAPGQEDSYVQHVQQRCELVDGAGNPRRATCRHCGRDIQPGFVDDSDTPGWVHAEDDEAICDPRREDGRHAEPSASR
jgi:hypothetical protein